MSSRLQSRRFFLQFCICLLSAWGIFAWPWMLPPTKRVISDSYNMGFNNMLSILAVGFSLLALIAFRWYSRKPAAADEIIENRCNHSLLQPDIARWNRRDFFWAFAASLASVIFIFELWSQLPNRYYGEMKSFIPCSELILLGRAPYTQFQFNYGPLFLYLPVWIVRASANTIGVDLGYIYSLAIFSIVGLLLLSYATTIIEARRRPWIFLLLATPFIFNLGLGMNYTAMRFAAPYAALLWLHRCAQSGVTTEKFTVSWRLALAFAGGVVFCFAISPEIGLSFLASALIYLGFLFRGQSSRTRVLLAACITFGLAASLFILASLSTDYFLSIWSFGGGGYNLPVVPGIYILFYLATLAFVVPRLAVLGLKYRGVPASLVLGWSTLVVLMVAPSLGRCDFGHILCNGLGAFLGAFLLTSQTRGRAFGFYAVIYAFLFTGSATILNYGPYMTDVAQNPRDGRRASNRVFWKPASSAQREEENRFDLMLKPYLKVGTPLGCSEQLEIYLKRTGRFIPEFYTAPAYGAFTQDQVAEKTREIQRMDIILVPSKILAQAKRADLKITYTHVQEPFLQKLLIFPITYRWRNEPLFPDIEWAKVINRDFKIIGTLQDYSLMKRQVRSIASGN